MRYIIKATIENSTYIGLKSLILDNVKIKSSRIMPNSTVTKNILKKIQLFLVLLLKYWCNVEI